MFDRLTHYLQALKMTCRDCTKRLGDEAYLGEQLKYADNVLARLIVEQTVLPEIQATAFERYSRLFQGIISVLEEQKTAADLCAKLRAMKKPENNDDFDNLNRMLKAVLNHLHSIDTAAARDLNLEIVQIEHDYLQQTEDAFLSLVKPELVDTPENSGTGAMDAGPLTQYLRATFAADKNVKVSELKLISGGFSKHTLAAKLANNVSLPDTIILRKDTVAGMAMFGTTVLDEFSVLSVLHSHDVCVPRPLALESSGKILGNPFLIVAWIPGSMIGQTLELPAPDVPLCKDIAAKLAQVHAVPVMAFGKRIKGADISSTEKVLADVDRSYADWVALNTTSSVIETAFKWVRDNMRLAEGRRALVHGDYTINNMLVDESRVTAVLDWEFAGIGNPAYDLGYFFCVAEALASWEIFLEAYETSGGILPIKKQLDFYIVVSALRLGVMCYQLEVGFNSGQLKEIRHAFIPALGVRELTLRISRKLLQVMQQT